MTEMSNPFETLKSLRKYEKNPGQSQKFLGRTEIFPEQHTNNTYIYGSAFTLFLINFFVDRVGQNFRWPVSMDDCDKHTVFFYLTDEDALEYDDETALNLIFFFDNIDKGTFDEHKDSWVLVYKQEVKKYGSEYTGKELVNLEEEMPGAIYLPVDKSHRDNLAKSPPARTVSAQRANQEHIV